MLTGSAVARRKVDRHLRRMTSGDVITELSPEHVETIHRALMREALPMALPQCWTIFVESTM